MCTCVQGYFAQFFGWIFIPQDPSDPPPKVVWIRP